MHTTKKNNIVEATLWHHRHRFSLNKATLTSPQAINNIAHTSMAMRNHVKISAKQSDIHDNIGATIMRTSYRGEIFKVGLEDHRSDRSHMSQSQPIPFPRSSDLTSNNTMKWSEHTRDSSPTTLPQPRHC
jgi:hypothetical protein